MSSSSSPRASGLLRWLAPVALQAAKAAIASAAAWFIAADVLGNSIPVFAPLAALLTVQVTIWESVSRGFQRVIGVIIGVLVAYGFARLAGTNAWSIGLVIFVSFILGRALRLGQQGSVQVPVSALLVLTLGAVTKGYGLDRVVDTALGAAIGILVNLVVLPHPRLERAQAEVRAFGDAAASLLEETAAGISAAGTDWPAYLERARQLSSQASAVALEVQQAETASRWNPTGKREREPLGRLNSAVGTLARVERPARGIVRALADMPPGSSLPAEVGVPVARLLERVAAEIRSWAAEATGAAVGDTGAVVPAPKSAPKAAPSPAAAGDAAPPPSVPAQPEEPVSALYHEALLAARSPGVVPELAAVGSSIALDAHRISDGLRDHLELEPVSRLGWQSVFGR